jgi:uncharacterized protein (TIGR03435 family)
MAGSVTAPPRYLPWVVACWFAGAVVLSLRLLGGCLFAVRLRTRGVRPAPPEWQLALDRLRAALRLVRPVRLLVSAVADVPAVVGWLRPVVVVPAAAFAGLPADYLEALLLHELAHVRRWDALVNLAQSFAEILLFYHPTVWWVSSHVRSEREHCCDDLAVAATGDVLAYARALAGLESARRLRFTAALAATGSPLAARIARLLGQPRRSASPAPAAAVILIAAAAALLAQSAAVSKFEVASIKPSSELRFMAIRPLPGGRLTATAPVKLLIQNAYFLQDFQIVGGPSWIDSDRFEIDAKAEGNPTRDQLFRMLGPLLEDRFQLKTHRETRELPVYALAIAKNGPKLTAPKEGACSALDPSGPPPPPPRPGQPLSPPCGHLGVLGERAGVRIQGGQIAIPELIRILAMVMGRPVLDRTGLSGTYDISVVFFPDSLAAGLNHQVKAGDGSAAPPATAPDNGPPSIVTALQEQLGLKLDSAKGPVEVLVIDHIERPTAN